MCGCGGSLDGCRPRHRFQHGERATGVRGELEGGGWSYEEGGVGAAGWRRGEMTFNFTPSSTEDSDCENPTLLETVTQYLVITYNE